MFKASGARNVDGPTFNMNRFKKHIKFNESPMVKVKNREWVL